MTWAFDELPKEDEPKVETNPHISTISVHDKATSPCKQFAVRDGASKMFRRRRGEGSRNGARCIANRDAIEEPLVKYLLALSLYCGKVCAVRKGREEKPQGLETMQVT